MAGGYDDVSGNGIPEASGPVAQPVDEPAEQAAERQLPAWADLPETVRSAAIGAAARVIGSLPADRVPHALAQVARFVDAKRAKSGAAPIARALEHDAGFRALVAESLPADFGRVDADPAAAAARSYLLHLPDTRPLLAAAARADEVASLRAQVARFAATIEGLTAQLANAARGRSEAASAAPAVPDGKSGRQTKADPADHDEIVKLRARLRQQGTRVREAQVAAADSVRLAGAERDEAVAQLERERANAEAWRLKAEQEARQAQTARQALDRARAELSRDRADGDRRIELLLDTLVDAAAGLRREWRLATGGADPADVVVRDLPAADPRPRRQADAALLRQWLGLPGAHVIVDGYNVTKTGYPDLTLADQRDRLIRALGALAARTGADVTVVFDGAAVVAAPASTRDVRVVFSPPGVIADDVIRRLAAAEPAGRVVVVVTSDREVVDSVRRSGARTAPSQVLLEVVA